jgi:flavodoxin I
MKVLVVYDSVFGNTEQVAQAMGQALAPHGEVETLRVTAVQPEQLAGVGLLIVGSPTRAFRATPATTNLLKSLPAQGLQGVWVAAFDTRIAPEDTNSGFLRLMVKLFGYAAKPLASRMQSKGGTLALPPEGFFVGGTEGPLKEGELERAAAWAEEALANAGA